MGVRIYIQERGEGAWACAGGDTGVARGRGSSGPQGRLLKMESFPAKDGKYLRPRLHLAFIYYILIGNTFLCFEVVKSSTAYIPD